MESDNEFQENQDVTPEIPANAVLNAALEPKSEIAEEIRKASILGTEMEKERTYFLLKIKKDDKEIVHRYPFEATEEELERYEIALEAKRRSE